MDAARWRRVQELFHAALEREPEERATFLDRATGTDPALRARVEELLEEDARDDSPLDRTVGRTAREVLEQPQAIPRRIGPYRLEARLGEGGMGVVYRAVHEELGLRVALKVLRDGWVSEERRDRFAREQRTLARLVHPGIARIHDAHTLPDGTPWFVMELVEGEPLDDYCRRVRPSLEARLGLFRQVCEAVQHAHGRAVIHRDLKPSNILVTPSGEVRLVDFGIAKWMDEEAAGAAITREGRWPMTLNYAAPEQIRGEAAGTEVDVHALGVILWELVVGRPPRELEGLSPTRALEAAMAEPEPPSAALRAGRGGEAAVRRPAEPLASELDLLCLTAMHRDPERRYATVEALIRDLDHLRRGRPLDARPDSVLYRARMFLRRNRAAVTATAAGLVLLVGTTAYYTQRLAAARDAALAESARAQRVQAFLSDLFRGGGFDAVPADTLRVRTLLDRAAGEVRVLEAAPAAQADFYHLLGAIDRDLGRLGPADSLLSLALERRRRLPGDDPAATARVEVDLGVLRAYQNRLQEGEEQVRRALAELERSYGDEHPATVEAALSLGNVLNLAGRFAEADSLLARAEAAAERLGLADVAAEARSGRGEALISAGRIDEAEAAAREALTRAEEIFGPRHPRVVTPLLTLALVESRRGRYDAADTLYRRAQAVEEGFTGEESVRLADVLVNRGINLNSTGRVAEAEPLLRRALAIRESIHGPRHPEVATVLSGLGSIAYWEGDHWGAAELHARAAEIYRESYDDPHPNVATELANQGTVILYEGAWQEAERLLREALAEFEASVPDDRYNLSVTRIKLGIALVRAGRVEEGEREARAGYDELSELSAPDVSFLHVARGILAEAYQALGRTEEAERFRALYFEGVSEG